MKILSAEQIRALDAYTIKHEPIASIDLMERAANTFFNAIQPLIGKHREVYVFCGMGNNGGDGLAVGRMLIEHGYTAVNVYVVRHSPKGSADFEKNERRLASITAVMQIEHENEIPVINSKAVVIDAIFGTGLSRPAEGLSATVIQNINRSAATVYAIDVPSGLYTDKVNAANDAIVKSAITFTFHSPKLSFLLAQNGVYVPAFKILDIGLDTSFEATLESKYVYVDERMVHGLFKKRDKFSHKGSYGHTLIAAGSYGKMGAAVLAVSAALRSGAGLVSAYIPLCGYSIMQTTNPEAMVLTGTCTNEIGVIESDISKYSAIGAGPGIGTGDIATSFIENILANARQQLVLDADALNVLSEHPFVLKKLPAYTILTPHPGEFKRLAGTWSNDVEKIEKQLAFSKEYNAVVVLKGAHTSVSTPDGRVYFNSTGNPGMAKGGSGDVLTGIITALAGQGYEPATAAITGVYIHGLAGDFAAEKVGLTGMTARDIIHYLPSAFALFDGGVA